MNTKIKIFIAGAVILLGSFVNINTVSAQSISTTCSNNTTTTTISGRVLLNGSSSAGVWFEWGPTQSLGNSTTHQNFTSDSTFSQQIFGLIENTTYYYRAMGSNDSGTETGDIKSFNTVCTAQVPTVTLTADNTNLTYNSYNNNYNNNYNSTYVRWTSTNATSCNANGGANSWAGSKGLSGSFSTGNLNGTTTYNITCTNNAGTSANASVTINVNNNQNYSQATVNISADRTNINYNDSTTIRWYPTNASSCYASGGSNGWAGSKNIYSDSFFTGALAYTTTYTIACNNTNGGTDTKSVTVVVNGVIQPTTNSLTATTTAATQIFNTSAQLNSLIVNTGNNNDSANAWFEWGRTINLGNTTTRTSVGSLPSVIHADTLSGLTRGTTYYFRAVAENSLWRNVGSILSFTTTGENTIIIEPVVPTRNQTSLILITSSVNRNQPIVPTIDNTRPHPGDEINYTVNYQNVGNGAVTNLVLQIIIPSEVDYISSNPNNPIMSGNTLIFKLGTLKANSQGAVTVKVRVKNDAPAGTTLNFPAILSYINPSGQPQSVNANVSAQVWGATDENSSLGASVFGSGVFFPTNLFGWLLLLVLILVLILLAKYAFAGQPFNKRTTTTTIQQ